MIYDFEWAGEALKRLEKVVMLHRRLPRIDLPSHSYYIGCCIQDRKRLLRNPRFAKLLLQLYAQFRDRGDFLLHAYVVMPEHYHVLLSLEKANSISSVVRKVHSLFSREYRKATGFRGRIWQRRFYDHVIRNDEDWLTKMQYIHDNPVRASLVENIEDYRFSSFLFWETGEGPIRCDG